MRIGSTRALIASSDSIRRMSHGAVRSAETLNYRTHKPVKDGLFCPRVFGPTRNYECECGRLAGQHLEGETCPACGVEILPASVRRDRMGHIELPSPVIQPLLTHPNSIRMLAALLELEVDQVGAVLAGEIRLELPDADCADRDSEEEAQEDTSAEMPVERRAHSSLTGPNAIRRLLQGLQTRELADSTRRQLAQTPLGSSRRPQLQDRLEMVDALQEAGIEPSDLCLTAIPVIPPDLRPIVDTKDQTLSSSLNDRYRLLIQRAERLCRLQDADAPPVLIEAGQIELQAAAEALMWGRKEPGESTQTAETNVFAALIRASRNTLSKRVDFSLEAEAAIDETLACGECVLPRHLAERLFEAHIKSLVFRAEEESEESSARNSSDQAGDATELAAVGTQVLLTGLDTTIPWITAARVAGVCGNVVRLAPDVASFLRLRAGERRVGISLPLSQEAQAECAELLQIRQESDQMRGPEVTPGQAFQPGARRESPLAWWSAVQVGRRRSLLVQSLRELSHLIAFGLIRAQVAHQPVGAIERRHVLDIYEFGACLEDALHRAARVLGVVDIETWAERAALLAATLWRNEAAGILDSCGLSDAAPPQALLAPFDGDVTILEGSEGQGTVLMLAAGYLDEVTWDLESRQTLVGGLADGLRVEKGCPLTDGWIDWDLEFRLLGPERSRQNRVAFLATLFRDIQLPRAQMLAESVSTVFEGWYRRGSAGADESEIVRCAHGRDLVVESGSLNSTLPTLGELSRMGGIGPSEPALRTAALPKFTELLGLMSGTPDVVALLTGGLVSSAEYSPGARVTRAWARSADNDDSFEATLLEPIAASAEPGEASYGVTDPWQALLPEFSQSQGDRA